MPVNYHQIQQQIREMGQKAPARMKELQDKRHACQGLLSNFANNLTELNERVDAVSAVVRNLRCARPVNEALTGHFTAQPSDADYVLMAA
ncbi:MAG: hypothetical protein HGA86_02650, partial [Anaerolineaceae bacterium]|nr:hypothetical protein [Anaerolineaceae bacterium]